MPETFFPAILSLILGKKVILDVGDEWLTSPTYVNIGKPFKFLIWFIDTQVIKLFRHLTVTSDYLLEKYGRGQKVINFVNYDEFKPLKRSYARKILGFKPKDKIVLSFGNTMGATRKWWLDETCKYLDMFGGIEVIRDQYFNPRDLPLWLGACDLVLFPTGDNRCERACFPIRVGTCLNAERVIATDESPTEFHNTLKDCLLTGKTPYELAVHVSRFFMDGYKDMRVSLEENVLKAKKELDWDKHMEPICELMTR